MSSRTGDIPTDMLRSSTIEMQSFDDLAREMQLKEEGKQKIYTLGKSYDTVSGKIVTMTGKAKEGEKGVPPATLEALQKTESVKIIPVMTEYEVLEAIADEKSRRGPEVHTSKRRLSESLAPIKEADSRRQSPEEEDLQRAQVLGGDGALHTGLESVQLRTTEQAPEGEVLKVGLFGPRRKSLSEWRYSQEPAFTVASAHYLTEAASSRVVVTVPFIRATVSDSSMMVLRQHPSTLNLSVSLAVWLYVQSSQPKLFTFVHGSGSTAGQRAFKHLPFCFQLPVPERWQCCCGCSGGEMTCLKQHRPSPNSSLRFTKRAHGHLDWLFYFPFLSVSKVRMVVLHSSSLSPPPPILSNQLRMCYVPVYVPASLLDSPFLCSLRLSSLLVKSSWMALKSSVC